MAIIAGQVQTLPYQYGDSSQMIQSAQNLAMTGAQGISDIAGQAKDYFKQQGEKKKLVKQSSLQIDAALQLFPDLAPSLQSVKERMRDENIPLADRAAEAEVVANLINMGVGEMRNRSKMSIEQEQAMADAIYKQQQLGMEERRTRATEFSAAQGAKPTFDLQKATITSPDGKTFEMDIPYDKEKGMFFDPGAGKYIKDVNKWGFGESSYVDGEAMPTPTSQNDIIAPSTAYSFGKAVGGPDELQDKWTNKGYTSTGPNLVEGVVAVNTNKYPLGTIFKDSESGKVYVAADRHGNKDSRVIDFFQNPENYTGGKTNKRLSIIGSIPKNKIPKTKEGMSQLIEQYSNVPDYSTSSNASQIDGALSMGGDMSQQAMGTPDQQAEVANMIEQGAGMATSQAAPSGAMPTEPRMAQPQPTAQQAPQYQVRPGFVPVGGGQQQNTVKVVTGEEAQNYKLPPSGTYEISLKPDGSLAGTEKIIIPPINEEQSKKETKIEQEQALRSAGDAAEGIRIINKLTQSSGFAGVFGAGIGLKYLPATETRTAENYRKKLVALATTDTMRKFQGLGQMSDKEFGVAQDSATMLSDPGISEEAAASELNRLRSYFATSIRRAEELGRVPKGTAQKLIEQSMSAAGAQGGQSNQAESDASFIQGFRSGE
jgi:hypothetical protein